MELFTIRIGMKSLLGINGYEYLVINVFIPYNIIILIANWVRNGEIIKYNIKYNIKFQSGLMSIGESLWNYFDNN